MREDRIRLQRINHITYNVKDKKAALASACMASQCGAFGEHALPDVGMVTLLNSHS